MSFNGFCSGNDMKYSSEGSMNPDRFKLKVPKPSYDIIVPPQNNGPNNYLKVDFKPTKEAIFQKENIPERMIDLTFHSISTQRRKQLIALLIKNKCLESKNPIFTEKNLIFYCHENETDLLRLVPFLIDISLQMKCDVLSFDYMGFGRSNGKAKINTIFIDGEDTFEFAINKLNYKIENIIFFGTGIGAMSSIHLASRHTNINCKALILCMPLLLPNNINIKVMRSIFCQTLLIKESENKDEMPYDEVVNLCKEIPNEKEWFPRRKNNEVMIKSKLFMNSKGEDDYENVYSRHRKKFITKIREYVHPEKEIFERKIKIIEKKNSSIVSTDSTSIANLESDKQLPIINDIINNKNILNENFDDNDKKMRNIEPNIIKNKSFEIFDDTDVDIENDEDY